MVERINWNRNNNIKLRCFSEAVDFHDLVKLTLVKMLRRKHKSSEKVPIYTEFDEEKPNEDYPDIFVRIGKDKYVFELQDNITDKWLIQIAEKHKDRTLIIVPLKKVFSDWNHLIWSEGGDVLGLLRRLLEVYVF